MLKKSMLRQALSQREQHGFGKFIFYHMIHGVQL